jgi:sec-independent protein translocase protein TatC
MNNRQPLVEHLREIRNRLLRSVVVLVIVSGVAFFFAQHVFFPFLMLPAGDFQPIYTEITELLATYVKVSLLAGFVITLPYIVLQIVMFVRPALLPTERKYLYLALPGVSISFLVGVLFGYFVLLPPALNFLLTFGSDVAQPTIRIGNYVSVVITLLLWLGLSFEMPFLLYLLSRLGIVQPKFLAKQRRWAIVLAFVLGAIITPTFDPLNQTLVAVPLIVLYEMGTQLSKLAWKQRGKETANLVPKE